MALGSTAQPVVPEGSGEPVTSAPSLTRFSLTFSSPSSCSSHMSDVGAPCSGPRAWTLDPGFAKDLLWDPQVSGPGEASSSPVREAGVRARIPSGSLSYAVPPGSHRESIPEWTSCSQLPSCSCCKA